jgi:hypothetical protein
MVEKMQTSAMIYEIPSSIETTGRRRTTGRCWGWHRKRSGWPEVVARRAAAVVVLGDGGFRGEKEEGKQRRDDGKRRDG